MLRMFLFTPTARYSGGCLAIAAATIEDARKVADASRAEIFYHVAPIALKSVPGVMVSGRPRIVFNYTYME
jgi:hypothetical protein